MTFFDVFILSIIEGITEFLPVSSTAHLYIAERILGITINEYVASFTIIIQVGALIGTALYMYKHINSFEVNFKKIVYACIPTMFIGFILYEIFKTFFVGNFLLIGISLIVGSLFMLTADYFLSKIQVKKNTVTTKDALLLGFVQAVSIIPGVSRSGAVLVAGYFSGIDKKTITQFSFLIGLPVAYVAALYDIYINPAVFSSGEVIQVLLGIFLSGVIAYFIAGFFLKYVHKITLTHFAWYRIILGIFTLLFLV